MQGRKKLGLTQDKLAEALGVTAQAVSKWENDQSCPDITMLPRLAELFHISTDELLGVQKAESKKDDAVEPVVLEGTVEDRKSDEDKHGFEFNWEPGRRDAILLAALVLAVGLLTLLSTIYGWGASFWNILWPCAILWCGIGALIKKFSFFGIACTLFGGYFLLENLNITSLNVSWKLIFPILVLLLGIRLLVDAFKQPKHSRWHMRHNDKAISNGNHNGNLVNEYSADDKHFNCSLSFCNDYRQVNVEHLVFGKVECAFGELTLDLCGCEGFAENCHVDVDCSFGSTTILVPRFVQVVPNSSTAFAGVEIQSSPDADTSATIYLDADVSFGSITVCYT